MTFHSRESRTFIHHFVPTPGPMRRPPSHDKRTSRWGLATFVVITLAACAASTPETGRSERLPNADYPRAGTLDGVDGALAVVEGTVLDLDGPRVELAKNGYVDIPHLAESDAEREAYPSLLIGDITFVADLNRGPEYEERIASFRADLAEADRLRLWHTDGMYEPGRRYAFFLGIWDTDSYSTLYGYDIDNARPASGFRVGDWEAEIARAREMMSGFASSDLDALIALARGLNAVSADAVSPEGDVLRDALFSTPSDAAMEVNDNYYPVLDDDPALASAAPQLEPIQLVIVSESETDDEYALRGAKTLGWFGTNTAGYVVISGFVPANEPLTLVVRDSNPTQLDGSAAEVVSVDGANLVVAPTGEGSRFGVIDLSSDSRATLTPGEPVRFFDEEGFFTEMMRLQPILDVGVDGPERDGS